ncbi:uncharacterized protein N7479_009766 [Penicillium vulpinum]|uniref:uncharacterized protein n=1 Tax=Penicillium vulpinum TaxID=29845 RepID=UPI0025478969|nr:uncharacterized protein N7479_009766 [Penicillium vulpinum]KAJ5951353.1 hypothetical protein N7479_009766 [Penicillium vulpinum]
MQPIFFFIMLFFGLTLAAPIITTSYDLSDKKYVVRSVRPIAPITGTIVLPYFVANADKDVNELEDTEVVDTQSNTSDDPQKSFLDVSHNLKR